MSIFNKQGVHISGSSVVLTISLCSC